MKINLKNLTQRYCPLCYSKLKIISVGQMPQGMFITCGDLFIKREIKKTDKSSDYFFAKNPHQIINKVSPTSYKNAYPIKRLKLNNKMHHIRYIDEKYIMTKYTIWQCLSVNCNYYKAIDEVEYDFNRQ